MNCTSPEKKKCLVITSLLLILVSLPSLTAYSQDYNFFYRVYFRDKGTYTISSFSAEYLLSQRAIERRQESGIDVPVYSDLPVFSEYTDQLKTMGFTLHGTSKWMNSALLKTKTEVDLSTVRSLPFVADAILVKKPAGKSSFTDKLDLVDAATSPPPFDIQLTMLNGYHLHNAGYDGTGILVAILDGGFTNADKASSLSPLRNRDGIKLTYDFINKNSFVYSYHSHGMAVLSVLAGQVNGYLRGTAPGADFMLLRTEDGASEFPVEEDYWTFAAEFADSAGADIISSSLGYFQFDDPAMNYSFSDLDGNTAFVTRAADMAVSKGMLVVASAGNERNKNWIRIIAPSDGDSVLAAGAVDRYRTISSFSSAGPSADGRVKPDLSALGVEVMTQTAEVLLTRLNGTSFSCPVLSGMSACLMEAVPQATASEIIESLRAAGDRYYTPDSLYGYGIPDMNKALSILQDKYLMRPENETIVRPNPFSDEFEILFNEAPGNIRIEIANTAGVVVFLKDYGVYAGRSLIIRELAKRSPGLYFVRIVTAGGTFTHKIIKMPSE